MANMTPAQQLQNELETAKRDHEVRMRRIDRASTLMIALAIAAGVIAIFAPYIFGVLWRRQ